jgi:hypothetical protein
MQFFLVGFVETKIILFFASTPKAFNFAQSDIAGDPNTEGVQSCVTSGEAGGQRCSLPSTPQAG